MEKGVVCSAGGIDFVLIRKSIKNMYIRISREGEVRVTANRRVPMDRIQRFVCDNAHAISQRLQEIKHRESEAEVQIDRGECQKLFEEISLGFYPLFEKYIGQNPPQIKIKPLRATWGICHTRDNYISLSERLILMPREAVEYVILHEYAHFVYPNHQRQFYKLIESIMPDYKKRKEMLKTI